MRVEPIRDKKKLGSIASYLKKTNERNYMFFMTGIYTAFRVSDLINLRVKDVKNMHMEVKEKKTGKYRKLRINPILRQELEWYCEGKDKNEFLFPSRQGYNQPISRVTAFRIMQDIGDRFGLCNIGTHSLRKTFGYHHYKQFNDIGALMRLLNHSHPSITLAYIGLIQDDLDAEVNRMRLF